MYKSSPLVFCTWVAHAAEQKYDYCARCISRQRMDCTMRLVQFLQSLAMWKASYKADFTKHNIAMWHNSEDMMSVQDAVTIFCKE